jgi:cytidine deaminase
MVLIGAQMAAIGQTSQDQAVLALYDRVSVAEGHPFVIPAECVSTVLAETGLTIHEFLQALLPLVRPLARPVISNYPVTAALQGSSGAVYLGVNIEFPGLPLDGSIHAEQFAILNARQHREKELIAMATSVVPCGYCRQFIAEIGDGIGQLPLVINGLDPKMFASFFPEGFDSQELGIEAHMLAPQGEGVAFTMDYSLRTLAFQAAVCAYAPYTKAKAGVAIQTRSGTIYAGSYVENAAFNPSVSPLQAALVSLVASGEQYENITGVMLVEREGAAISHLETARLLLKHIAPQAFFSQQALEF